MTYSSRDPQDHPCADEGTPIPRSPCPRCGNGVIEQYDDGSTVSLVGYAGGANALGSWGTLDLDFTDAEGKGYTRHYVASDGPAVAHWRPVEELSEGEHALFWHPLWSKPVMGRFVGGRMAWLYGFEMNALARLAMRVRPPQVSDGTGRAPSPPVIGDAVPGTPSTPSLHREPQ